MQITAAQKRRVAVFFIGGTILFLGITTILVGDKLLKREDCYYSNFRDISVAGLTEGSSVKFQGMNIGSVTAISINHEDTAIVKIDFCLKPGTPMKEGTIALLGNIGITGLKFLELKGGGKGKDIPLGGEIPSGESTWDAITGKASVIAEKTEQILNNINNITKGIKPESVKKIAENMEGITGSVNQILAQNKTNIASVISRTDLLLANINKNMDAITRITSDVSRMTAKGGPVEDMITGFSGTAGDLRKTLSDAKIDENFRNIQQLVVSIQKTVDTINLTLRRSQEDITDSFENLSDAMNNFNEFTRIIMENPSAIIRGNQGEQ